MYKAQINIHKKWKQNNRKIKQKYSPIYVKRDKKAAECVCAYVYGPEGMSGGNRGFEA